MLIAPAAGCHNRSNVGYSISEATGGHAKSNRHREPSFASGLDPSPGGTASCGSDGAAFSTAGLPRRRSPGSLAKIGGIAGFVVERGAAPTRSRVSRSAKSASSALVLLHILRRFSRGGPEAVP